MVEQQKAKDSSPDQRCQRAFQEAANWITDFGSSNRLEINSDKGRQVSLEMHDGYIEFTIGMFPPGDWYYFSRQTPEGLCFLEERRHERTSVIDEDVPVTLRLEQKDFMKMSWEKRAEASEKNVDRMKFELENAGILPKR